MKSIFLFPLFSIILSNNICFFNNQQDAIHFKELSKKIKKLQKQKEYKTALVVSKKMLNKAIKENDTYFIGKSYYKMAECNRKLSKKDSAFYYYIKSKAIFIKINDSIQIARNLLNIAIIESDFGNYIDSDQSAILALTYFNGKRKKSIVSTYNCLAISSRKQHQYKEAISYYNKALRLVSTKKRQIILLKNKANVYRYLKEYEKSIRIFKNLLDTINLYQYPKARVLDNLAYTQWLASKKENVLSALLEAKSIRIKENDTYGLLASYAHLSDYYEKKNKKKSLTYAYKMYAVANVEKSTSDRLEALQKIIKREKLIVSKKYFSMYVTLNDSLQQAKNNAQNKFAKIKYHSTQNEKEALKFKTIASENKLIAIKENIKKKNITVGSIFFILGLFVYIYIRKEKRKKEKILDVYETETRIAKTIHDGLANNVFQTMNKIQYSENNLPEILNDLEKIYLQTRDISHQNDSIETGADFEKTIKELLSSYSNETCNVITKNIAVLDFATLEKSKQITIYRVLNELMVNMIKHSKATLVLISCEKIKNEYQITYVDNGSGFSTEKLILKNGLTNVETRMKSIGGKITFESKPNKGLTIVIDYKK